MSIFFCEISIQIFAQLLFGMFVLMNSMSSTFWMQAFIKRYDLKIFSANVLSFLFFFSFSFFLCVLKLKIFNVDEVQCITVSHMSCALLN